MVNSNPRKTNLQKICELKRNGRNDVDKLLLGILKDWGLKTSGKVTNNFGTCIGLNSSMQIVSENIDLLYSWSKNFPGSPDGKFRKYFGTNLSAQCTQRIWWCFVSETLQFSYCQSVKKWYDLLILGLKSKFITNTDLLHALSHFVSSFIFFSMIVQCAWKKKPKFGQYRFCFYFTNSLKKCQNSA